MEPSWREAGLPGKGREGKAQENGLQRHLAAVHHYGAEQLTGLEVIRLVFTHQRIAHAKGEVR